MALPLVAFGGGYYYLNYRMSQYPQSAKRHLRKALLAHDYNIGNIHAAPAEYRNAYAETVNVLPKHSREAVGVLEKLVDLYEEMGADKEYEQTLHLLFSNIDDVDVAGEERYSLMKSGLKCAQKLADINVKRNKVSDAAYYYKWILEKSIMTNPSKDGKTLEPLKLQPFATVRQVGSALEQTASLYAARQMYELSIPVYMKALEMLHQDTLTQAELQAQSATMHNNIGECFSQLGDFVNAEKFLKIAVELTPKDEQGVAVTYCI
jgi:tetratricopeptide (TPR) repeat protein